MKVFIKGLNSCIMRKGKLQQYRFFLSANGHTIVNNPLCSDIILVWTCGFRKDVHDNSIKEIERYKRDFKAEIVAMGCLPDINSAWFKKEFKGRIINWRDDEKKMEDFFGRGILKFNDAPHLFAEKNLCDNTEIFRKKNPDKDATFHDQFIKLVVSEGCNYKCTYCSERLAFPPYHSFPLKELVESCRKIVKETGYLKVILLADSIDDYGCDIGSDLSALIKELIKIHPGMKIALNNMNPAGFIRFYDEIAGFLEKGYIQHLNLPIQSASDKILKLMNRPYGAKDIEKIFDALNKIGFKEFDTHIIIGFPGEEDEDFNKTMEFITKHKPKYVLASCFMEAPLIEAKNLPCKIDEDIKKGRIRAAERIMKLCGIICNSDDGELSMERCRRLNLI